MNCPSCSLAGITTPMEESPLINKDGAAYFCSADREHWEVVVLDEEIPADDMLT